MSWDRPFLISGLPNFRHYVLEQIVAGHIFLYADRGNAGIKILSPEPFPWASPQWQILFRERGGEAFFELLSSAALPEPVLSLHRDVSVFPSPRYPNTQLLLTTAYEQSPSAFLLYSLHGS